MDGIGIVDVFAFAIVFHCVGAFVGEVRRWRENQSVARALREMSKIERSLERESMRRVK